MITPGAVTVGTPTTPQADIDNAELQNPNANEVQRQLVGIGDPEFWDRIARVLAGTPAADAHGVVVRQAPDNYDSGLVTVPDSDTAVTAVTTRVTTLLIVNDATQIRHLTLKDGAGGTYITAMPVPAKSMQALALGGVEFDTGVTVALNSGQSGLKVQVVGRQ